MASHRGDHMSIQKSVLKLSPQENPAADGLVAYQPYLKELRSQLLKVFVFFAIGAAVGGIYYQQILSALMNLFKLKGVNLVLTSPYQFIDLSIKTGLVLGILFALPIFIFYLLKFIRPALNPREFRLLIRMLPISIILFITGFGFGAWVIQFVIDLFSQTSTSFEVGNIWDLSGFFSEILVTGLSLALIFQLPVVLSGLIRLKVVAHHDVLEKRKIVYAGLLIFAAILPTTDIISLTLLTLIPLFLFEITLLLNART